MSADVRWTDGAAEFSFGAEEHEPSLEALQDYVCNDREVFVTAHEGEQQPPYQAHVYLRPKRGYPVWAGVMHRPDRQWTTGEVTAALAEWRTRRGQRPPVFHVEWWVG